MSCDATIQTAFQSDLITDGHTWIDMLEKRDMMPYLFDVVDGTHLAHKAIREHIDRVGQVIYVRSIK